MSEQNEKFHYTYSASQQEEISKIRKKYLTDATSGEVDKMEQLRQLDAKVTRKAMIPALTVGIISALIMGIGMSFAMTDIADLIGLTQPLMVGIVIGMIGMIGVIAAYPLYHRIIQKERKRVAPQIIQLANELSKDA